MPSRILRCGVAEYIVRCFECQKVDGGARQWRWLCHECAVESRLRHHHDTGHLEVNISVRREPTIEDVQSMISRVHRITKGW